MSVTIVESNAEFVTLQLVVPLQKTFLETEETLQSVLNQAGTLASGEALKQFDTDGSPIESGVRRWTRPVKENYQRLIKPPMEW